MTSLTYSNMFWNRFNFSISVATRRSEMKV